MTTIADSDAVLAKDRVLPQHQAALTILQSRLADPRRGQVRWLDVACGRGQILASLKINLSDKARAKLVYLGFDGSSQFARQTRQLAESLALSHADTKVGDLADFEKLVPSTPKFDFITFTNSAHEVAPPSLAALLVDATLRLDTGGTLFVYDMESVTPNELGAIPWRRDEFRSIILTMLEALGCEGYEPEVGSWPHRTTSGWNAQIQREFMKEPHLESKRADAIQATTGEFERIMRMKLESCRRALEELTQYGSETETEREDQTRLLFEFWGLSRALQVTP